MALKIIFIIIGLFVGLLQYGLIKTAAKYMSEKNGSVVGVIAAKIILYGIVAVALMLWFKEYLMFCAIGIGTGLVITAVTDQIRNRKKQ